MGLEESTPSFEADLNPGVSDRSAIRTKKPFSYPVIKKLNLSQFLFSKSVMMGRDNDQAGQTICDALKAIEVASDNRCPDLSGSQSN